MTAYKLIPPDMEMFEITSGEGAVLDRAVKLTRGFRVPRTEWTGRANENVRTGIEEILGQKRIQVKDLPPADGEALDELKEIQALFRVVNSSIRLHTFKDQTIAEELEYFRALYGGSEKELPKDLFIPFIFPEKEKNFLYSLGPLKVLSREGRGSYYLIVNGCDEVSNEERRHLVMAGVLLRNMVKTPIEIPGLPEAGHTSVGVAVIDDRGDILWYNAGGGVVFTVLDANKAEQLMKSLLMKIPGGER
jgi:hypothetical protein